MLKCLQNITEIWPRKTALLISDTELIEVMIKNMQVTRLNQLIDNERYSRIFVPVRVHIATP